MACLDDEDHFPAIAGRFGDIEGDWYRHRALAACLTQLVGAAVVGVCWVLWDSAWGAVFGLPLMAGADLAWIRTLRCWRRWRHLDQPLLNG